MLKPLVGLFAFFLCFTVSAKDGTNTNIIFLIGDGMGAAYTSAYRLYKDNPNTRDVDATVFDQMFTGMASTHPDDPSLVTDSAAAATALACGVKTFNGAIGVDSHHLPVLSILDKAKHNGYLTGIVVTSQVNHATPAAFVAHADSRQSYDKIADQYVDLRINDKPKVDLIFGGGQEYFIRKDRNLIKELRSLGYSYESNLKNISKIKQLPAIGLFAKVGMEPALKSSNPLRLSEMTESALILFQNASKKSASARPFFLLLEASQIDWCGHANDIACAMGEMQDMAVTMELVKQFIDKNPNTIFVATADHSTGGLSLGAKGQYQWGAVVVQNIKATAPDIARQLFANKSNWKSVWQVLTQIKLADDEQKNLDAFINQLDENGNEINISQLTLQILTYIDKYTATGWTTKGHTGEDVQVFSYGKGHHNFVGAMDNTDIAKKLMSYLNH